MKAPPQELNRLLKQWSFLSDERAAPPKTFWRVVYGYWMKFARTLGKVNALVLLTLVYIVMVGPAALVLKILRKDLLDRKAGAGTSYWYDKLQERLTLERSRQQF